MSLALASRRAAISPAWVKNPLWRTARAVPSLDLRFADTKSLADAVTGQSLVTFTRASSGTYVDSDGLIKTAATNEPRFDHNPTTGESLGLLVEESRTNNVLQSEDFATTWTASNIAVTTNSVVAPDGTTTADTIAPPTDGLTVTRFLRQSPALTTQQAYTFSVFAKVGTAATNGIALYVSDSTATNSFRANFNLINLLTSPGATGWAIPTATIVPYPNGWYRCILSGVTSTAHASLRTNIYLSTFGNVADNYGSIHVWGAQLEAGAFPTSYIPTTAATATRSADVASITGTAFSSWYRQDEGTFYSVSETLTGVTATNRFILEVNTGTGSSSDKWDMRRTGSTAVRTTARIGGVSTADRTESLASFVARAAAGANGASVSLAVNGGIITPVANTVGAMPAVTQMQIGNGGDAATLHLNGTIRRLCYWGQRLPNSTLQALTQ